MVLSKPQQNEKREVKRFRKSVKFAANRPEIVARPDYSTQDKQNCWYSHHEYKVITFERRSSLQTLRKANFDATKVDEKEHCPWGLEQMQSIQHLQHFKARQKAIVQAVLAEQKWQKVVSTRADPESLRLIATSFSRISLESALERAVQDARLHVNKVLVVSGNDSDDDGVVPVTEPQSDDCSTAAVERTRPARIVSLQA